MFNTIAIHTPDMRGIRSVPENRIIKRLGCELTLPASDTKSKPLVLCPNNGNCDDPDCKFVHADITGIDVQYPHLNFTYKESDDCFYERYATDGDECIVILKPHEAPSPDSSKIPLTQILKTRVLDDPARRERGAVLCAHFFFNRKCALGAKCGYAHQIHLDPSAETQDLRLAPGPSEQGIQALSKKERRKLHQISEQAAPSPQAYVVPAAAQSLSQAMPAFVPMMKVPGMHPMAHPNPHVPGVTYTPVMPTMMQVQSQIGSFPNFVPVASPSYHAVNSVASTPSSNSSSLVGNNPYPGTSSQGSALLAELQQFASSNIKLDATTTTTASPSNANVNNSSLISQDRGASPLANNSVAHSDGRLTEGPIGAAALTEKSRYSKATVKVHTSDMRGILSVPRGRISHMSEVATTHILCKDHERGECDGTNCDFVHADITGIEIQYPHLNYMYHSADDCFYERYATEGDDGILILKPHEAPSKDQKKIPLTQILKTRVLDDPARRERGAVLCAHFFFNRKCALGAKCGYAHQIHIDPNAETKAYRLAPGPSQQGIQALSKNQMKNVSRCMQVPTVGAPHHPHHLASPPYPGMPVPPHAGGEVPQGGVVTSVVPISFAPPAQHPGIPF